MYQNLATSADPTERPREPKDDYERGMRADALRRGGEDSWFDDFSDNVCSQCGHEARPIGRHLEEGDARPAGTGKLMTNARTMETRCLDCWGFSETWVG